MVAKKTSPTAIAPVAAVPLPAWGAAFRWSAWIGAVHALGFLAARMAVTFRYGGPVFTPRLAIMAAAAALTAFALWPALALAARTPLRAHLVRSALQWAAIALLAAYLVVGLGSLWDDTSLQVLARVVAPDVVAGGQ
jgi:hypothetical protein